MAVDNLPPKHGQDSSHPDWSAFQQMCNHCWHPDREQPNMVICCWCDLTKPKGTIVQFGSKK